VCEIEAPLNQAIPRRRDVSPRTLTGYRSLPRVIIAAGILLVLAAFIVCIAPPAPAVAAAERPPEVSASDIGARISDVTVETYGVTNAEVVKRYLSLHAGDALEQQAVERDYTNLKTLAGLHARLEIRHNQENAGVSLHWIVLGKWFDLTDHPFYGDQPLTIPIEGFGWVFTSHPLDSSGTTVSSYSQVALRAQLARIVITKPLWVDSKTGREGDLIANTYGARGVFRASEPVTEDVYSWLTGNELVYLDHGTNGTQVEFGIRNTRSTSAKPTYITAPSVFDTFYEPARNTTLEAGVSHRCPVPPTQWYPPYCHLQYRVEGFDSIGGLGATTETRTVIADAAQYNRIGSSTLVFHGSAIRTGGVIATSGLLCAYTFGYAKATCGTDANLIQAEFRIADARPGPLKFILFTETASSRIRNGDQPFAPSTFAWRADSGVGVMYHGFRFNLARGNQGNRITYEVLGQLF
jgi:hypothetical protein